jgi:serine/threonine-protein kinase
VYALGVIVFRWLGGEFPFEGDSDLSILLAHVAQPLPREPLRHLPDAAIDAIARALDKDATLRHSTAGAFIEALRAGLDVPRAADARSDAGCS